MGESHLAGSLLSLFLFSSSALLVESAIGVNWGTVSSHRLSPSVFVDLMKENKIQRLKLFDVDPGLFELSWGVGFSRTEPLLARILRPMPSSSCTILAFKCCSAIIGHANIGTPAHILSATEFQPQ